jgi:hypothetical protein
MFVAAMAAAALLVTTGPVASAAGPAKTAKPPKGFKPLFDGKTLNGWDGDPRLWSVDNGEILGSTEGVKIKHNTFLITKKKYSDFILQFQVKIRNHNSGVQFRSEALNDWIVKGLQADLAQGEWWGSIYDERGKRGVIVNGWTGKAEKVVKPDDWNDYEIYCVGDHIRLTVNGLVTAEITDTSATTGIIALQLHAGPPMQVRFRNLWIKTMPAKGK